MCVGYGAFLDRARCHRLIPSLRADPEWESSCTFTLRIKPPQRCRFTAPIAVNGTGNVILLRELRSPENRLVSPGRDNAFVSAVFQGSAIDLHPGSFAFGPGIRRRYIFTLPRPANTSP